MKHTSILLGAATLCLSPLSAQLLSRGEQQLTDPANTAGSPVGVSGFGHWQLASPDGNLAADPGAGLAATAGVVYAIYTDENPTTGGTELMFRRSVDGGITWTAGQSIYTVNLAAGEFFATGNTRIRADGHNVVVMFLSNAHDTSQRGQSGWALASWDQGQSWSQPILLSGQSTPGNPDQLFDVDDMKSVLDGDTFHVCFEADYLNNPAGTGTAGTGSEDLFYAQATIDPANQSFAITVPNLRIDSAHAPGSVDVDAPEIDADSGVVSIVWNDDRNQVPDAGGVLTNQNDTYSRTSLTNGTDFGTPAATPEYNHTNYTVLLSAAWAAPRSPNVGVVAPNVYVFMEDSRDGQSDAVYVDVSMSGGIAFSTSGVRVSQNAPGEDVDNVIVAHDGDLFAVFTKSDRPAVGTNATNQGFVYTGRTGDLTAGTMTEATATSAMNPVLYDLRVQGEVIACVYEMCSFPEEAYVSISHDHGASFAEQRVTTRGSCSTPAGTADVDDVRLAITANRDINVIWADDRNGNGNVREDVWITSTKVPTLIDNTVTTGGGLGGNMRLVDLSPSDVGDWAFLMISAAGTTPNNTLTPSLTNGFIPNLTRDFWFDTLLADITPVLEIVGTNPMTGDAEAVFDGNSALGIPNLRVLTGLNFWVAAGTAQMSPVEFKYFTDTLMF